MYLLQIVITLEIYGVKRIVGIPFGYRGLSEEIDEMPVSGFCFKIFNVCMHLIFLKTI